VTQGSKSLLFLKKKKKKDFSRWASISRPKTGPQENKRFLVLFFKKERASLWP